MGAGSIGTGWAIAFASAGLPVRLYDTEAGRLAGALAEVRARLQDLASFELLAEPVATVVVRIAPVNDLTAAVAGATHVQECVPERLELKRDLFAILDELAPPGCPLASSSSFIPASRIAAGLRGQERCLVVHPGNPPYLLRVAEVVPAPFTSPAVVDRVERLLASAGLATVRVGKEVEGFVFNRLQGAVLREAYRLVRDGVATVAEIDQVVRDGLGLRWSVTGPFETADLNSRGGIAAHAATMGPAYARLGAERGEQDDPWAAPDLVAQVTAERRAALALAGWAERVAWRDRALMALLRSRRRDPGP